MALITLLVAGISSLDSQITRELKLVIFDLSGNVEVISYVKIGELININLKQLKSSCKNLFRNILKRLYQLRCSWLQVKEILSWMSGE